MEGRILVVPLQTFLPCPTVAVTLSGHRDCVHSGPAAVNSPLPFSERSRLENTIIVLLWRATQTGRSGLFPPLPQRGLVLQLLLAARASTAHSYSYSYRVWCNKKVPPLPLITWH